MFRIVLALASAGIATFVPGFLRLKIKNWLSAGGALAVFAIVYFFSPATLVVNANDVAGSDKTHGQIEQHAPAYTDKPHE